MGVITFGAEYTVNPKKDEIFAVEMERIIKVLANVPGHIRTRLYEDAGKPCSYLVYSEWESKETFEAFIHSDTFAAAKSWGRDGILTEVPRHHIFTSR